MKVTISKVYKQRYSFYNLIVKYNRYTRQKTGWHMNVKNYIKQRHSFQYNIKRISILL